MIYRLDPRFPLVWRDPHTAQLGVDPPRAVLTNVSASAERVLAALAVGATRDGLDVIADGTDVDIDQLLHSVEPALRSAPRTSRVAVSGGGPVAAHLGRLLGESGVRVSLADSAEDLVPADPELAVVIAAGVVPPSAHALWLRRDVPHLPIVLGDDSARLGPVIEPDRGPCLTCLELHHRDEDPAWPAIAAQLFARTTPRVDPVLAAETAAAAASLVLGRLREGPAGCAESWRIGSPTRPITTWEPHPDCGCRGLRPVRTGIDSAAAAPAPDRMTRPTTARGDDVPA